MNKQVIIIGAGEFGRCLSEITMQCFPDSSIRFLDDRVQGTDVIGKISEYTQYINNNVEFVIAIGNNKVRQNIAAELLQHNGHLLTLIHPTAYVSPSASIGDGSILMPKAVINSESIIGKSSIIDIGVIIDHCCIVGNYVHVKPGAIIRPRNVIPDLTQVETGRIIVEDTMK